MKSRESKFNQTLELANPIRVFCLIISNSFWKSLSVSYTVIGVFIPHSKFGEVNNKIIYNLHADIWRLAPPNVWSLVSRLHNMKYTKQQPHISLSWTRMGKSYLEKIQFVNGGIWFFPHFFSDNIICSTNSIDTHLLIMSNWIFSAFRLLMSLLLVKWFVVKVNFFC